MPPVLRRLSLCACAAVAFLATASLLHSVLPLHVPEVTPKLNYIKAHAGDFDTVFIGSSRIYHGISPKIFDATMQAAGTPTHSFNLAVNGMMPPESINMTRALIAMHPPHLKRVFLEIAGARGLPAVDLATVRDMYWQDPTALSYALQRARVDWKTTPSKYRWRRVYDDLSRSLTLFARNELNIGWLIPTPSFDPPPDQRGDVLLGPDRDGYLPERHPLKNADRATITQWVERQRDHLLKDRQPDPLNEQEFAAINNLLAGNGIQLTLVMAPVTTRDYHTWHDAPPGVRLLAFDDPVLHPELYAPEHRLDPDHLNDDGAQIFSRELAEACVGKR